MLWEAPFSLVCSKTEKKKASVLATLFHSYKILRRNNLEGDLFFPHGFRGMSHDGWLHGFWTIGQENTVVENMLWGEAVYLIVKKQRKRGLTYVLQKYEVHDLLPQERTHLPEFQPPPNIVLSIGYQLFIL